MSHTHGGFRSGFSARRIGSMELADGEAATNIFEYASPANPGEIDAPCASGGGESSIGIRDSGTEFDITKLPEPTKILAITDISMIKLSGDHD